MKGIEQNTVYVIYIWILLRPKMSQLVYSRQAHRFTPDGLAY